MSKGKLLIQGQYVDNVPLTLFHFPRKKKERILMVQTSFKYFSTHRKYKSKNHNGDMHESSSRSREIN